MVAPYNANTNTNTNTTVTVSVGLANFPCKKCNKKAFGKTKVSV